MLVLAKISILRLFISIACILYFVIAYEKLSDIQLSQLPILPKEDVLRKHRNKMHRNLNCTVKSLIPCLFWMTTKNVSDLQPTYWWITEFSQRNLDWHIHISDDNDMDKFMEKVFRGTKVLWAFNMLNRKLGPARADIWRYAVLWVYGGGYMDTDSYIRTPLNKVITEVNNENKTFVFGAERRKRHGCYNYTFHLHEDNLNALNITFLLVPYPFNQNILFSRPGHPLLRRILENFAEIVVLEYMQNSPTVGEYHTRLNQEIICTTGPMMFTYSIIEEIYHMIKYNATYPDFLYLGYAYSLLDASMKMIKNKDIPHHYGNIVFNRRSKENLLKFYVDSR